MLSTLIDLLLPPTSLAVLALAVLWLRRWARLAVPLLGLLVLLSLPAVSETLLAALDPAEEEPAGAPAAPPGAIVILSADVDRVRGGGTDIGALTLERERAGASLARRTGLPVLVTGGIVTAPPPVGELMQRSMQEDFGVTVRWVEARSPTTWENAAYSAPLLRADGIGSVYLVTHAWHMRRSLVAFRKAGLEAKAAPVRMDPWPRLSLSAVTPRASSWMRSYFALHEWVGLLFYSLRA